MERDKQLINQRLGRLFLLVACITCLFASPLTAQAEDYVATTTIGGTTTNYGTFAEAVSAANAATSDVTVTLIADVDLGDGSIKFSNTAKVGTGDDEHTVKITLNLNGKTLQSTGAKVIEIAPGANVEIVGGNGVVMGSGTDSDSYDIYNNGTLALSGVTITGNKVGVLNTFDKATYQGEARLTIGAGVVIKEFATCGIQNVGTLTLQALPTFTDRNSAAYEDIVLASNLGLIQPIAFGATGLGAPTTPISVKAYNIFNSSSNEIATLPYVIATGFTTAFTSGTSAADVFTVPGATMTLISGEAVAMGTGTAITVVTTNVDGSIAYLGTANTSETLALALDYADEGSTMTLLSDFTGMTDVFSINPVAKNLTIELGGNQVSGNVDGSLFHVLDGATATIVNGSVSNTYENSVAIYNEGALTMSNVAVTGVTGIQNTGTLTVSGGSIRATGTSKSGIENNGTLKLNALPTFNTTSGTDIFLAQGKVIDFTGATAPLATAALAKKIAVKAAGDYPRVLTSGYAAAFTSGSPATTLAPADVFTWADVDACAMVLENGEAVLKVVTVITLEQDSYNLEVLDEVASGATLTPADAGSLTYTSSNENVATVVNGIIMARGEGSATITVSFAGNDTYLAAEDKTIAVTVSLIEASVSLDAPSIPMELVVDDELSLVATTSPDGLSVTFVSDNPQVASVSEDGLVKALAKGTATITATVGGDGVYKSASTTLDLVVAVATELDLTVNYPEVYDESSNFLINGQVKCKGTQNGVKKGAVDIYLNGDFKCTVNVVNKVANNGDVLGSFKCDLGPLNGGKYTLFTRYQDETGEYAQVEKTVTVTIYDIALPAGLSTYYNNRSLRISDAEGNAEGVKMYAVTNVSNDQVTLKEISNRTIPGGTPVIISNNGTEAFKCLFEYANNNEKEAQFAQTFASDLGTATPAGEFFGTNVVINGYEPASGATLYGFNGEAFVRLNAKPTIAAHRCWLELSDSKSQNARRLTLRFDGGATTGISDAMRLNDKEQMINDKWYTLDGRRLVGAPKTKGVYIHNGHKVAIK